jgi:thiol-disulfide isomerase/thioredoxin
MKRIVLGLLAAAVLGGAAAVVIHVTGSKAGLPAVGQVIPAAQRPRAPEISGTTLTGRHLDVAGLRGHVVVLNFWGSWCAPCRAEAPVLARVAADTGYLGVRFAGIDIREDPASGLAFERLYHVAYPSISDPGDVIAAEFGASAPAATPTTYILDTSGRIAWAWFGRTYYQQLELAVVEVARG